MQIETVVGLFPDLDHGELVSWIEQSFVQPEPAGEAGWHFHEIDIARVRLIYDLRRVMGTPEDQVALVLSLLDQVYELRSIIKGVSRAAATLPAESRDLMIAALRGHAG
jgi:chaperone modulatory protein CbpM